MNTTETQSGSSLQRVVRRRPRKPSETFFLDGGAVLHIDRAIMPLRYKCDLCGKRSASVTWDEGDILTCLDCIEKWEKKHKCHWEDGTPLKPPNDRTERQPPSASVADTKDL